MWFPDRLPRGVRPRRVPDTARARRTYYAGAFAAPEALETRILFDTFFPVSQVIYHPGPPNEITPRGSVSDGTTAYYSTYLQSSVGSGIYRTDGTAAGTRRIGQVPGGQPTDFTLVTGRLYFLAGEPAGPDSGALELYTADPATGALSTPGNFGRFGRVPRDLVAFNGRLYFVGADPDPNGNPGGTFSIYSTDGTASELIHAAGRLDEYGTPTLARVGDWLYFGARSATGQWSVYRSDGTAAGTQLVAAIPAGAPSGFVGVGDKVVFNVRAQALGSTSTIGTLWVTDGTAANTRSLNVPGATNLLSAGNFAVYTLPYLHPGGNVWRTDGTSPGTVQLTGLRFASSPAVSPVVMGGAAYVPSDNPNSRGLYRVTADSVSPVFETNVPGSVVAQLIPVGDRIYFSGTYRTPGGGPFDHHQNAVMVTDGTREGTWILEDRLVGDGPPSTFPNTFRRTGAGVVYGNFDTLHTLPVDAPGLAKFSGRLFRDLDRDGVYDPGSRARRSPR